jgi:hypothetical protein
MRNHDLYPNYWCENHWNQRTILSGGIELPSGAELVASGDALFDYEVLVARAEAGV